MKSILGTYQDSQLKQLSTERETLRLCVRDLQESYGNHQQKMNELKLKHSSLEIETEQLNTQVEMLQRELKAKGIEMDEMKKSGLHSMVTEEINNRDSNNGRSQSLTERDLDPTAVFERHQKETGELGAEMSGERDALEDLQKQLSEEQTRRKRLERELEKVTADHDKVLGEVLVNREGLEKELAAVREEIQSMTQEHLTEDNRNRGKTQALEAEVQRLQGEVKVCLEREKVVKEAQMSETLKIKDMRSESDKLRKELEQVEGVLKKKDEDMKRLADHSVALESQIKGQREELDSLSLKLSSALQEAELLKSQLGEAQTSHEAEKGNLKSTAKQSILSLEKRVTEQLSEQKALEKMLENRNAEIQSLRQEREGVASELERKGKELVAMGDTLTAMTTSMEKKEEELAMMKRRVEELQGGVADAPQSGTNIYREEMVSD